MLAAAVDLPLANLVSQKVSISSLAAALSCVVNLGGKHGARSALASLPSKGREREGRTLFERVEEGVSRRGICFEVAYHLSVMLLLEEVER